MYKVCIVGLPHCRLGGVFIRLRRSYFCRMRARIYQNIRCRSFPLGGHFEISEKSNSVRTRGRRDAIFSHDVGLDVGTRCTRNGVAAMLGVAARWRWKKIFERDFLRNRYRYRRAVRRSLVDRVGAIQKIGRRHNCHQ